MARKRNRRRIKSRSRNEIYSRQKAGGPAKKGVGQEGPTPMFRDLF